MHSCDDIYIFMFHCRAAHPSSPNTFNAFAANIDDEKMFTNAHQYFRLLISSIRLLLICTYGATTLHVSAFDWDRGGYI